MNKRATSATVDLFAILDRVGVWCSLMLQSHCADFAVRRRLDFEIGVIVNTIETIEDGLEVKS